MKNRYPKKRQVFSWILVLGIGTVSFFLGRTSVHSQRQEFITAPKEQSAVYSFAEKPKKSVVITPIKEAKTLEETLEEKFFSTFDKMDRKLILVNKDHAVPEEYEVTLVPLEDGESQIADYAYEAATKMLSDGEENGLSFYITSSYRDKKKQQQLIDEDVHIFQRKGMSQQEAEEETFRETMPAGHSEHQTGLALDIVAKGISKLNAQVESTEEYQWLKENCAKYGFILRYPQEKSEITKINYEPWHFRYVGVEAAQYIMEHQLCFEEFIAKLP